MDPVKKKLLKTRHNTSVPREEIDNEDRQILVWVGQEEKIVSGLTKHTTCEDVVKALLDEYQVSAKTNNVLFGSHKEHCIMESWKNYQRILPPTLKMLKLLKSWAAEQMNVSFFLMKTCTLYPCSMWQTPLKNLAPNNCRNHHNAAFHVNDFPLHIRKRIIRKAFRKLRIMKKHVHCTKENNITQLIHIIMSQDNIIKQQMDRMKQLDNQLEAFNSCQQLQKFRYNGENVVSCMKAGNHGIHSVDRFSEMYSLENLMYIQEKLNYQHMLIRKLSDEIEVEMYSMCTQEDENLVEEGHTDMGTTAKHEIDESLQVGLRLHSLCSYIQKEIQYNDSILLQQKKEYRLLKDELKSVCASNSSSYFCYIPQQYTSLDICSIKEVGGITTVLSGINIKKIQIQIQALAPHIVKILSLLSKIFRHLLFL